MEGYGEFLFLKLADPNTGAIPQNALMHAYNTLKDRGIIKTVTGNFRSGGWQPVNDF